MKMNRNRPAIIHPTRGTRRGPRPRAWYEACVRHALRNYSNPRALRRNPLSDTPAISALVTTQFSEDWNPQVAALRHLIDGCVNDVLGSANDADRQPLEVVLRGAMSGRTIRAIAADLSYGREWLHKTWWPEAVRAVTFVMLQRYLRIPPELGEPAPAAPAQLRAAI